MNSSLSELLGVICLAALLTSGCEGPPLTNSKQAAGEYAFKYKTGEIEVLQLSADMTYRQEFYKDLAAKEGQPIVWFVPG